MNLLKRFYNEGVTVRKLYFLKNIKKYLAVKSSLDNDYIASNGRIINHVL